MDDIRNLIDQTRIPPQIGKYSIYIIDEVHMLSASAFNAFLKTLEEPPSHAVFILATTEKHKIIPTILSRCQIFDFNRIQIVDIVGYLEMIASRENVSADPEGLNIIAQKADGAMRDALSIFDQIVSFSGGQVSYKNVIDNLNVLDYDYYFRLTDFFLEGNISAVLNTFAEILENGFDAHHFINGLAGHFRDLLVSRDPETLQLLEVGASIREQYKKQARSCSHEFLLSALEITGQCDLNYRLSRNQRLHVELALLQLAGLGKEKKKPELTTKSTEAKPDSEPELKTVTKPEPLPQKDSLPAQSKSTPEPKQAIESGTTSSLPENSRLRKNMEGMPSVSLKELLKEKDPQDTDDLNEDTGSSDAEQTDPTIQDTDFSGEELLTHWKKFAIMVREEKPRLYSTLVAEDPIPDENKTIAFEVSNKLQMEAISDIKPELVHFLRKQLNNNSITLDIKINEKESESKPYHPEEKFSRLAEKNPALYGLKQDLSLDFE